MITFNVVCAFAIGGILITSSGMCHADVHTDQVGVITVIMRPAYEIFSWTEDHKLDLGGAYVINGSSQGDWHEKEAPVVVVENNKLLSFYRKVYSRTSSLVLFVDTNNQHCPINLFQQRVLAYVTTSSTNLSRFCPDLSDVISRAAIPVVLWSFDLSTFMSQFLMSWTNNTHQPSYALLFDKSGREHFLSGNNTLAGNTFVFESTFPVDNCSDPFYLVKTAAKTDIRDIVMIATSRCVSDMIRAISLLRLPATRFRWLLYPTDGDQAPEHQLCAGLLSFCDQIKPLMLVERNKPQKRPADLESKLLQFSRHTGDLFTQAVETHGDVYNCSLTCSHDCSGCQLLFQHQLTQISGQDYEIFPESAETERKNIVFDLYRLASTGNVQVGSWSALRGLSLSQAAYPPNFTDTRLTVAVVVEPPFVFKNDTNPNNVSYYGYSIDVFKEIAIKVGFEYDFAECSPGGYGLLENEQWTGCIGNIVRGEADVILGALTVTVERDRVMDFTLPYYDFAGIQIMIKKEDSSTKLFYYASVFTTPAWLSIFGVLAVTSIFLWVFERIAQPRPFTGSQQRSKTKPRVSIISKESGKQPATVSTISSELSDIKISFNNTNHQEPVGIKTERISEGKDTASSRDNNGNTKPSLNPTELEEIMDTDLNALNDANSRTNLTDLTGEEVPGTEAETPSHESADAEKNPNGSVPYSIGDSIWFVVGALTMAGGGDPPRSLAGRVLVAGFWFFTVIIMSTFTANLAAFLTVSRLGTSISSLDDLAAQNEINYSTVKYTSVMEYFKRMATIENNFYEDWKSMSLVERTNQESRAVWDYPLGNKYNTIWKSIREAGLIDSNEEGLARVKAGGFALITESPTIRYYTGLHCDLEAVGEQFSTRPYAIGLKDKFPYTSDFSQAILDLQKDRVLGNLQFKWWSGDSECAVENTNAGLSLYLLSGTFIIAGAGLGLGVITLGIEHIIVRIKRTQK